jgi:hypothetical protein
LNDLKGEKGDRILYPIWRVEYLCNLRRLFNVFWWWKMITKDSPSSQQQGKES